MKNIDELIEKLAKHIEECLEKGSEYEGEIAEKTKALAELVSARAKLDKLINTNFTGDEIKTEIIYPKKVDHTK